MPAECIVVDDGSTDDSALIARRSSAEVVSTGGRFGPARARNLGARKAQGDLLLFVDADVALDAHALERIAERFERDPGLDALIGSYDDSPADPGLISQFKNLMHAFVHQGGNRQAFTFWCGCGAVKREVYLAHGGLDESYRLPSIEDIEFGFRMMKAGRKLELDPEVHCKHLKVWTLGKLVYTDVFQRGIPWTELILRTGFLADDLNLRKSQRVSVLLTGLLALLCGVGIWQTAAGTVLMPGSVVAASAAISLLAIGFINRSFYGFLASRKGGAFTLAAFPLHILYFFYSGVSFLMGAGAYFLRTVPPPAPSKDMPPSQVQDQP